MALNGKINKKTALSGSLGTNPRSVPISVDRALNLSSSNPVQNKVITAAITNRLWSDEVKQALLQLAQKVAYVDADGQTYYDALYNALYPPADLDSITAVFDAGGATIYDSMTLDDLKQYLTVTACMTDGTTEPVTNYALSGSVSAGEQTITASYGGKTTTFTVTVVEWLTSISAVFTQGGNVIYDTDSLDTLTQYLTVTANYADGTSAAVSDYELSGALMVGTSTITVAYGGKTDAFNVTVSESANTVGWAIGGLSSSDGSETVVTNRARTDFIQVNNGDFIMVGSSLNFIVRMYDSNKNFIGSTPQSGWCTDYHVSTTADGYIRVVMKKSSDEDIVSDELDGIIVAVNDVPYYLGAPKYAVQNLELFIGKGTSGTTIIDNANRGLSAEIPISDISSPIFMARMTDGDDTSTQFALKFTDNNGGIIASFSMRLSPEQETGITFGAPANKYVLASEETGTFVASSIPSGAVAIRLLFANYDTSSQLTAVPTGYIIINERRYKLTEGTYEQ